MLYTLETSVQSQNVVNNFVATHKFNAVGLPPDCCLCLICYSINVVQWLCVYMVLFIFRFRNCIIHSIQNVFVSKQKCSSWLHWSLDNNNDCSISKMSMACWNQYVLYSYSNKCICTAPQAQVQINLNKYNTIPCRRSQ